MDIHLEIYKALDNAEIVLLFLEGSRGSPEVMKSIAHMAEAYPKVPVVPLSIYGAGKALPRGEALFVPFIIEVNVGEAVYYDCRDKLEYTKHLEEFFVGVTVSHDEV